MKKFLFPKVDATQSKVIKTNIETVKLTSFKDWHSTDWLCISDTQESFWKWDEKQCITITKQEAKLLAIKLMDFANPDSN